MGGVCGAKAAGNVITDIPNKSVGKQSCPCGNVYMDDSKFCRKCGKERVTSRETGGIPLADTMRTTEQTPQMSQ